MDGMERKMDSELKAKWVAALRSGEYLQAREALKSRGAFCCLGVLADVKGAKWEGISEGRPILDGRSVKHENGDWQDEDVLDIPLKLEEELSDMNDNGRSFPEIADYIEANIPADSTRSGQGQSDA